MMMGVETILGGEFPMLTLSCAVRLVLPDVAVTMQVHVSPRWIVTRALGAVIFCRTLFLDHA